MIRYQITDGTFAGHPDAWFHKLRHDVDFIQIRETDLSARQLTELVRSVLAFTSVPVLVNDRINVAIASGAAGVHLRAGAISPLQAKRSLPLIVTVAVHTEDDFSNVRGADYALLAPVFPPLSKPATRPPLGLQNLRRMAALSPVPILALGGITAANTLACIEHGAAGIAGITLFAF